MQKSIGFLYKEMILQLEKGGSSVTLILLRSLGMALGKSSGFG